MICIDSMVPIYVILYSLPKRINSIYNNFYVS